MRNAILIALLCASSVVLAQLPEGDLAGKIQDFDGKGVAGVELVFTHENDPEFSLTTVTGDNGSFSARNVKVGYINIKATKAGYPERVFKYTQEGKRMRQTFHMVPEGTTYESLGEMPVVKGTIKDTKGNPIPETNLKIYSEDLPGWEKIIKTDANGYFETKSLRFALVNIHANKKGYRDQIYQYDQPKKDYTVKDFKLQTLEEYFAETGQEMPGKRELTPEELAVDYYNKAVEPYRSKDFEQAKVFALKSYEANPKQGEALKILVYSTYNLKDYKSTLKYAQAYLELHPGDANITQYASESARMTNDTKLVKQFKEELKASGNITAESVFNDAVIALNAGNDEEGKKLLNEAISMDGNMADAYNQLGKIFIREGDFDEAIKNFKIFLKKAPKNHKDRQEVTDLIVTLSE